MGRYKIHIEFEGTAYSGWQIQSNVPTVEETIEKALSRILQEDIDIIGQGRTDSGVHAEAQVAHFNTGQAIDTGQLSYALLGVLPRDISVWQIERVSDDFHARFDAKARRYRYQVVTRPSPLLYKTAAFEPQIKHYEEMLRCAEMIQGEHDFESFSKKNKDQLHAECNVTLSELEKEGYRITYHIQANRFVHHMVRRLMGSMLQVGTGKRRRAEFADLLNHPHEDKTSHGAPAKGLILEKVFY